MIRKANGITAPGLNLVGSLRTATREHSPAPRWLMSSWSQMQCPAVNLMISPTKIPPSEVRDAPLVTPLVWRRWLLIPGAHPSGLITRRRRQPSHKEAALLVHSGECQARLRKFICISGCTRRARATRSLWVGMYTEGHQLIWVTRFFRRANI